MQCVYKNCTNNSRTARRIKGLNFHPFPTRRTYKAKFERWMQNCGVDEQELGRTGYVCSMHFADGAPTNSNPDPVPWDELSLDIAVTNKPIKSYSKSKNKQQPTPKAIVIDDDVPLKTLSVTASHELILDLECIEEELPPEQAEFYKKEELEYNEVIAKFEQLISKNRGEVIHRGDHITAGQYVDYGPPALAAISNGDFTQTAPQKAPTPVSQAVAPSNIVMSPATNTYQLVMDPRLGLIVGTMTPTAANQPTIQTQTVVQNTPSPRTRSRRRGGRQVTAPVQPIELPPVPIQPQIQPQIQTQAPAAPVAPPSVPQSNVRPTEGTAVGGLSTGTTTRSSAAVVDLTSDDGKPAPDSREISFNKLQGKTYPSLVVVARPHLQTKEAAALNDRTTLDAKVKQVLVYSPTKFTEWLIQQGLVRSEQMCAIHPHLKLNLGMYSDVSKFPYSGGYVWISDCCPHRFVSVFNGSIFESSSHPPAIILKLIYHWACQTNIQNVVQWVKVDNLYVKGLFTWLRAACTLSLQKNLKLMGGSHKRIEVGVISLGTTSQDGSQRQVKVEVLGILDSEAKLIRLRAVEPLADGERNYKRRFSKILEPLRQWVHPDSIICTDLTVDKGTLQSIGFMNVVQSTHSGQAGNQQVMEYLRKIVPRMFQNTLSLLSRQIIQQFLDELVWREWYGKTANQAFTNMTIHLAEQTRLNSYDTLIQRLNKVSVNPFKNHWATYGAGPVQATAQTQVQKRTTGVKRPATQPVTEIIDLESSSKRSNLEDSNDPMVPVESYYYGIMEGDPNNPLAQKVMLNVKCCVCKVPYSNNIQLLDHLLAHAHNLSAKGANTQCKYCLTSLPTVEDLNKHIGDMHPIETKSYNNNMYMCVICECSFSSIYMLGKHMSRVHLPAEMPYQCGTCNYRSSSHRMVVDHFYREHNGATTIQCPFCLKSTTVWSSGRVMSTNVTFFLAHLQKHQKKAMAKKCVKCALWFIQKDSLKDHQTKAHESFTNKPGLVKFPPPNNFVMVPRSKLLGTPATTSQVVTPILTNTIKTTGRQVLDNSQHKVVLKIPNGMHCKECTKNMMNPDHYPRTLSCNNCKYLTDCMYAMYYHKTKCNKLPMLRKQMPKLHLPIEMHCSCGYSSDDGNQIAKHLATCDRKTVYPSADNAQNSQNTPSSMLDVLGLVRRNDDKPQITAVAHVDEGSSEDVDDPSVMEVDKLNDVTVIDDDDDVSQGAIGAEQTKIEVTETEIQ